MTVQRNASDQLNSSMAPFNNADSLSPLLPTVSTPRINSTEKSLDEAFYNGTGYFIEDEVDTGLNDIQTLFLACFATLIPLVISLFTAFGIRILWTKYKRRRGDGKYDGMLQRQGTSESLGKPLHSHLLNSEKQQSVDTQLAISTEDVEVGEGTGAGSGQVSTSQTRSSNHSTTNGSIITMTLKNNHLIVETEERNDLQEDSRETTMKYSPGARDGVFVVEVQQGVRRSPTSGPSPGIKAETSVSVSDQCALIHNPPDRFSDEETLEECDENDYYIETASSSRDTPDSLVRQARTGLTQSNSSLSSLHRSYCYTNQQCYDNGYYGYPIYSGYVNNEPSRSLRNTNKPKIMSAVYKHPHNASTDVPNEQLNSDIRIRESSEAEAAKNKLKTNLRSESVQEEPNRLGSTAKKYMLGLKKQATIDFPMKLSSLTKEGQSKSGSRSLAEGKESRFDNFKKDKSKLEDLHESQSSLPECESRLKNPDQTNSKTENPSNEVNSSSQKQESRLNGPSISTCTNKATHISKDQSFVNNIVGESNLDSQAKSGEATKIDQKEPNLEGKTETISQDVECNSLGKS